MRDCFIKLISGVISAFYFYHLDDRLTINFSLFDEFTIKAIVVLYDVMLKEKLSLSIFFALHDIDVFLR